MPTQEFSQPQSPKISVLMPAYNVEKYIGEAIQSILDQTFKDFEFIIIDDGSRDSTWEIINGYAARDSRIVAIQNEKNIGISRTRNKLIQLSKGKYVLWQDADDISLSYRLDHQYNFMEQNPDIGISGGYLEFFNEKGHKSIRKYAPDDLSLRGKIFRYSPVSQPAAIIRKECFEKTGYFPGVSPVAEDLAMSFQIGTKYKFANLQEVLIKYRESESNATHRNLRLMEIYTIFLRERYSHEQAYSMSYSDRIYNLIQYFLVYTIPTKLKISLFNLVRNSKSIS